MTNSRVRTQARITWRRMFAFAACTVGVSGVLTGCPSQFVVPTGTMLCYDYQNVASAPLNACCYKLTPPSSYDYGTVQRHDNGTKFCNLSVPPP